MIESESLPVSEKVVSNGECIPTQIVGEASFRVESGSESAGDWIFISDLRFQKAAELQSCKAWRVSPTELTWTLPASRQ
jgi:hypothetical protein